MSRLTDKVTTLQAAGAGSADLLNSVEVVRRNVTELQPVNGVVIDGVVYPLEGQPPVARSKGWGILPR